MRRGGLWEFLAGLSTNSPLSASPADCHNSDRYPIAPSIHGCSADGNRESVSYTEFWWLLLYQLKLNDILAGNATMPHEHTRSECGVLYWGYDFF